jgi:hypothetical protein
MSRTKIVKKTLKDQNLVTMFNQMLGGDGDPEIIAKKDADIKSTIRVISSILRSFATGPMRKFSEYNTWCDEFNQFAAESEKLLELPFKELKDHNQTRQLVLVCRELTIYAHFLQPPDIKDKWVLSHPGLVYEPFAFTHLDVKHIWNNEQTTQNVKRYVLQTISLLYNKCFEIYKTISSPDIDVKKFSIIIVNSIDKVKELPELNRCKEAFQKIKDSVELLENNFNDYYKDMIQSENPNTIIESFIVDVSQGQNMDLKLMRQFRTIINFYKKQSVGKIKDPNVKKLFDSLNNKMDMFEKKVQKQGPETETAAVSDLESDSSDTENEN